MGKKKKKNSHCETSAPTVNTVHDVSCARSLSTPEWEALKCSEAPTPEIYIHPEAWAKLSLAMFASRNGKSALEFCAYGVTRIESEGEYHVLDIVVPLQEATSAFVQPNFPEEDHQRLMADSGGKEGLFTHIHSHHDMNMTFSAYDEGGPLLNNMAAIVVNTALAPIGVAVSKTPCGKIIRTDAAVYIGARADDESLFVNQFRKNWQKPQIRAAKTDAWAGWGSSPPMLAHESSGAHTTASADTYIEDVNYALREKGRAKVVAKFTDDLSYALNLTLDDKCHYALNTDGDWWHEYAYKCKRKVYNDSTERALWDMVWDRAEVEQWDTGKVDALTSICPAAYLPSKDFDDDLYSAVL